MEGTLEFFDYKPPANGWDPFTALRHDIPSICLNVSCGEGPSETMLFYFHALFGLFDHSLIYAMLEPFDHSCHSYLLNAYCVPAIALGTEIHMVSAPFSVLLFTVTKIGPTNTKALFKQRFFFFFSEEFRRKSDFYVIGFRSPNDFIRSRFLFISLLSLVLYVDPILR